MNVGIMIIVFLLGVVIGVTGIIIISCTMVDRIRKKKELSKEDWKMGIPPDDGGSGGLMVYLITTLLVSGALFYLIFGNK